MQTYLGFYFEGKFYCFAVMAFGISSAPFLFSKCLKTMIKYWRENAIRVVMFLDGGFGMNKSFKPLFASFASENSFNALRSDSFSSSIDTPLTSPNQTSHTNSPKKKFPKFKLLNINFQSVRNKIPEFHTNLDIKQPDIVAGTESWLTPAILDSEIVPTNIEYAMFREDRTGSTGGAVFILLKMTSFQTDCEIVWVKIELVGTKPLYIAAYYRLKENDVYNADGFRKSLEMVSQQNGDIWILSDLNYPKLNWDKNDVLFTKPGCANPTLYDSFIETMLEYNLTQMVRDPTRLGNILDLYLTTNHTLVDTVNVIRGLSDHDIVKCVVDTKPNLAKKSPRMTYLYRKAD